MDPSETQLLQPASGRLGAYLGVFVARQIKGKTLLPMPINRDHVAEAETRALEK